MTSFIYPFGVRISHILMALACLFSYFFVEIFKVINWHIYFGICFGIIVIFRLFWGIIGTKYTKFKDFNFKFSDLKEYFLNILKPHKKTLKHNPASSYSAILMLVIGFFAFISGLMLYGVSENAGIFAFLQNNFFEYKKAFKEIHEIFANLLMILVVLHIIGALVDKFIGKNDSIKAIIFGKKIGEKIDNIKPNLFQQIYMIIWIITPFLLLFYMLTNNENIFLKDKNKPHNYAIENANFKKECESCHTLYPPFLLPGQSWEKMMSDLQNHFGENVSLDEAVNLEILEFLKQNSAEFSKQKAAIKILKEKNSDIIAITKTKFWQKAHKNVDEDDFIKAKTKSNCKFCHQEIENGLIKPIVSR